MATKEAKYLVGVYGSLREGLNNHHLLHTSKFIGEHFTKPEFTMLDLGAFPGVIKDGFTSIKLELYEVTEKVKKDLDSLEGYSESDKKHSFYITSNVLTPHGKVLIYIYNSKRTSQKVVETGDWLEYVTARTKKQ